MAEGFGQRHAAFRGHHHRLHRHTGDGGEVIRRRVAERDFSGAIGTGQFFPRLSRALTESFRAIKDLDAVSRRKLQRISGAAFRLLGDGFDRHPVERLPICWQGFAVKYDFHRAFAGRLHDVQRRRDREVVGAFALLIFHP